MPTNTILLPIPAHWADPTNPPGLAYTAANRPYLKFDGTTDELCGWSFRLPGDYASGLTIKVQYSMDTATTNNVAIRSEIMARTDGENIESDIFATLEASADVTVPANNTFMDTIEDLLTTTVNAGEYIALRLGRENGTTGTNATGDMFIWAVSLEYTTA